MVLTRLWGIFLIALFFADFATRAENVSFRALTHHSRSYDGKRVTLVGVIAGDGPRCAFYETGSDSQKPASERDTIYLEKIEILSRYPVVTSRFPMGVFVNKTSQPIEVHLKGGHVQANTGVPAHAAVETLVSEGQDIVVTSSAGAILAKGRIEDLERMPPFYDRDTQNFFYRISKGKIERVPAAEGRLWKQFD